MKVVFLLFCIVFVVVCDKKKQNQMSSQNCIGYHMPMLTVVGVVGYFRNVCGDAIV